MAWLACVGAQAATINTTLTVNATSGAITSSSGFTATGTATFTDASIGSGTFSSKFDLTATDSSGNYTAPYTIKLSGGDTITGILKIGPAILQGSGDGSATVTGGTGAYAGATGGFTSLTGKGSFDNNGITFALSGAGTISTGR